MPDIEMELESVLPALGNLTMMLLKEKVGGRHLPCWIGPNEGDAISVKVQGVAVSRPVTHDMVCTIIGALGAAVNRSVITELRNDTFYAELVLGVDGKEISIDCRPSDAVAVAVRLGTPIFANDKVMELGSIP